MKDPYFAFELAEQYLRAAGALAPNQWRVQANLGVLRLFQDRVEDGVALLGRAVALRGAGLHLHDETSTPYLRDAVRRAGVEQALLADGVLSR
jgi:hypothetical protein